MEQTSEDLAEELSIATRAAALPHGHTLKYHGVFECEEYLVVAMDLIEGQDLQSVIDNSEDLPNEDEVKDLARQICTGLKAIHDSGACHRDLKPKNIMATAAGYVIVDFGFAKLKTKDLTTVVGSLDYMAPELYNGKYNALVDMYACGVTLYQFITGGDTPVLPEGGTLQSLDEVVDFDPELWMEYSADCMDFIAQLLQPDPSKRLTVDAALAHDFLV